MILATTGLSRPTRAWGQWLNQTLDPKEPQAKEVHYRAHGLRPK